MPVAIRSPLVGDDALGVPLSGCPDRPYARRLGYSLPCPSPPGIVLLCDTGFSFVGMPQQAMLARLVNNHYPIFYARYLSYWV